MYRIAAIVARYSPVLILRWFEGWFYRPQHKRRIDDDPWERDIPRIERNRRVAPVDPIRWDYWRGEYV